MRLGIDFARTHFDAVLMDGDAVLASVKQTYLGGTAANIPTALAGLAEEHPFRPRDIDAVMLGTVQFLNDLTDANGLAKTAVIRLGRPGTSLLPPFAGWPASMKSAVHGLSFVAHGGHEFDGREISAIDHDELRRIADRIRAHGIDAIAISSAFSPINDSAEHAARAVLEAELGPEATFSLSQSFGGIGLLERENAAIVNAALRPRAEQTFVRIAESLGHEGIAAPLYVSQNDGTLMTLERARKYPVATFASGSTSAMRGASLLSGRSDCVVIDVGGVTTDIGVVSGGFPRHVPSRVALAAIRMSIPMPELISIDVGGGSLIDRHAQRVGPESIGHGPATDAMIFGGRSLTLADAAVAAGHADIGDRARVAHLDPRIAEAALAVFTERIEAGVEQIQAPLAPLPIVAVGGGAALLPSRLRRLGNIERPPHHTVANAIGTAIPQVSGVADQVLRLADESVEAQSERIKFEAIDQAIAAGADPRSIQLIDFDRIPIPYLPGRSFRFRAKAVGNLVIRGQGR